MNPLLPLLTNDVTFNSITYLVGLKAAICYPFLPVIPSRLDMRDVPKLKNGRTKRLQEILDRG